MLTTYKSRQQCRSYWSKSNGHSKGVICCLVPQEFISLIQSLAVSSWWEFFGGFYVCFPLLPYIYSRWRGTRSSGKHELQLQCSTFAAQCLLPALIWSQCWFIPVMCCICINLIYVYLGVYKQLWLPCNEIQVQTRAISSMLTAFLIKELGCMYACILIWTEMLWVLGQLYNKHLTNQVVPHPKMLKGSLIHEIRWPKSSRRCAVHSFSCPGDFISYITLQETISPHLGVIPYSGLLSWKKPAIW